MTPKEIIKEGDERARAAFYQLNIVDEDLMKAIYPNGCTLAQAIELFKSICHAEHDGRSILEYDTDRLLENFIDLLDGEHEIIEPEFYPANTTLESKRAFIHAVRLILLGFRNQSIETQATLLAAGLGCEMSLKPKRKHKSK